MSAFAWTDEQKAVLASSSRITLVRAGPGSGKTKVFAELVDRQLKDWRHRLGGIAALSFTNVAKHEIEARVCASTVAPHFVGTLDAFFLRYVVAPFGHLAGLPRSGPRLIPSPIDLQIAQPSLRLGERLFVPLFRIAPAGGSEARPEFRYRLPGGIPPRLVSQRLSELVLSAKRNEWAKTGRVTHADCTYLAASILGGRYGPQVRALLAQRFPVVCIDEFQDTNYFLGRAVLCLLGDPQIAAVVVGDVDQKIFGFAGVSPDLFVEVETLAGARMYPLRISQRCATRVCAVASALSRSGFEVQPKPGAVNGAAMVATHADADATIGVDILERAVAVARQARCADLAVLVRKRNTKARFLRTAARKGPPMSCRGVTQLYDAVEELKAGHGSRAVAIAEACVCRILFGDEKPADDEMRAAGVEPGALRREISRLLLGVSDSRPGESWGSWAQRVKTQCGNIATSFGVADYTKRLGAMFKAGKEDSPDEPRGGDMPFVFEWPFDMAVEVLTVHEAKGREFDAVLLYCPEPEGPSSCPSDAWWAPAARSEEREVAFVATTRARRVFVLGIHETTWAALNQSRPAFAALFEWLPAAAPPRPAGEMST